MHKTIFFVKFLAVALATGVVTTAFSFGLADAREQKAKEMDRSPVDVVLSPEGEWLISVNQTSASVSLVSTRDGRILDEQPVGERPTSAALCPDGRSVLVAASYSGDVVMLRVEENGAEKKLQKQFQIHVGFEPVGVAAAPDGKTAYATLSAKSQVAVLDLDSQQVIAHIDVGRWPRYLAVSPDGKRLAVGVSGDRGVDIVDTEKRERIYRDRFVGLNVGHLDVSADSKYAYFPWMVYRRNPITQDNIRRGWVLASRLARIRLDQDARREAISLDAQGKAVADPHGISLTPDEKHIVVSASGTHELLVFRAEGLPYKDYGGADHIDRGLLADSNRFFRIDVGGRPMGIKIAPDNQTVYVTNYLQNAIQVVDLTARKVMRSFDLGGPEEPSPARRGEAIFYDGRRSLDQWYSCHSCHYDGGPNSIAMDTFNDGTRFSFKTVLPLFYVDQTQPWTWHGWQTDLGAGVTKSLTSTMLGPQPSEEDVADVIAFLQTLELPPNPFRNANGSLTESAERGKQIFQSEKAACANCHSGPRFTDGLIHDVGLGGRNDRYQGFNTPSLLGVYRKVQLLHDGRAKSLEDLLTGPHAPENVSGTGQLTNQELQDLVAYLKSL